VAPPSGWYGGLNLGSSRLRVDGGDLNGVFARQGITGATTIDKSDTAWGLNLGYRIDKTWAVEGSYESLGRFKYSTPTTAPAVDSITGKYKAHAWSFAGLGYVPLGSGWSLYGKAGLARTTAQLDAASQTGGTLPAGAKDSNTGLLLGAGVNYDFGRNWYAKLGWDRYTRVGSATSTGRGDVDVFGAGIGWHF
jgi:OOP family OmpA-OmpF porin